MRLNVKVKPQKVSNHEGVKVNKLTNNQELERAVLSCLLFEDGFYENGVFVADRIKQLVPLCDPLFVSSLAIKAREEMNLRHVPLLLIREMQRYGTHSAGVSYLLERVIQRVDEITEYMAMYMSEGKRPLANQSKIGLAKAFHKFDEYQFAKYKGIGRSWSLRDVMFMVHPKPRNEEEAALFKRIANNNLETPDTWEVSLSRQDGISNKEKWERLLLANKMGAMAVLRNLRNFTSAGVGKDVVARAIMSMNTSRVLPFRFIAAAIHAPEYESDLQSKFFESLQGIRFAGRADVLVDVSGSMDMRMSSQSRVTRLDAACGLAMIAREVFDEVNVYSFSDSLVRVPSRHGFALRDAIVNSQHHSGTLLGRSVKYLSDRYERTTDYDRLIVITDEQSSDEVSYKTNYDKVYVLNVAPYRYGVDYGNGVHINGFSESVFTFMKHLESKSYS